MDTGWAIVIAATIPTIATLVDTFLTYQAQRDSRDTRLKVEDIHGKVESVHTEMNGMKDALIEAARQAGHAAGIAEGTAAATTAALKAIAEDYGVEKK